MADKLFFVDGPGGCGKTFLYNTLLSCVRGKSLDAIAVASSGIAAEILEGGRTAHSTFQIPIPIEDHSTCKIKRQSSLAKRIIEASLIIWDEAPMMDRRVFEAVSRSFCDILNDTRPFGGKVVVLGGDFRQILPVIVKGSEADILNATLSRSILWESVTILKLHENMRANGDTRFQQWLLKIGDGLQEVEKGEASIKMPHEMCLPADNILSLIDAVFPNIKTSYHLDQYLSERVILTSTNENVDRINDKISSILDTESKTYLSFDSIKDGNDGTAALYPIEFLNSLDRR